MRHASCMTKTEQISSIGLVQHSNITPQIAPKNPSLHRTSSPRSLITSAFESHTFFATLFLDSRGQPPTHDPRCAKTVSILSVHFCYTCCMHSSPGLWSPPQRNRLAASARAQMRIEPLSKRVAISILSRRECSDDLSVLWCRPRALRCVHSRLGPPPTSPSPIPKRTKS
jgi:hypothetical protein